MNWRKLSTAEKQNLVTIMVIVGAVLLLGGATVASWMWTPPQVLVSSENQLRGIASLRPMAFAGQKIQALKKTSQDLNIGCLESLSETPIPVHGKQVRISGKFCRAKGQWSFQKVTNAKSGVEGTPFRIPASNIFTTDYLSVQQGPNEVILEFVSGGSEVKTSKVVLNKLTTKK